MAIFHLRVSTISRSKGASAIAAYCYRNATRARDPRLGITYDYRSRRNGVASRFVEGWDGSKLALWQAAENAERRSNSCVAREIQVSIPRELTCEQGTRLTRRFAQFLVSEYGVAVDAVVHRKASRTRPDHNPHAHLLYTTRVLRNGALAEKTRAWDELVGKKETLPDGTTIYHEGEGKKQVEKVRRVWAEFANEALAAAGSSERIDHRSDTARGIESADLNRSVPRSVLAAQDKERMAKPEARDRERRRRRARRDASEPLPPQKVRLAVVRPLKVQTPSVQRRALNGALRAPERKREDEQRHQVSSPTRTMDVAKRRGLRR